MNYCRKSSSNNNKEEIELLNNHVNTIFTKSNNFIEERDDLLLLFNTRINENNKNILYKNIEIEVNKFKKVFTCQSKIGKIYEYIFHIFIKSDFNNIDLHFVINNVSYKMNIVIDKMKYTKIEDDYIFSEIENFGVYKNKQTIIYNGI